MRDRTLPLRFALMAAATLIASVRAPWPVTLGLGAFAGACGIALEWRLRASFDRGASFLATLALLASVALVGDVGAPDWGRLMMFGGGVLAFIWLAADPAPGPMKLALTSLFALLPVARDLMRASWWHVGPDNLLAGLFSASGLLYGAPILWLGLLGSIWMRRERPGGARLAIAALVPGALGWLVTTEPGDLPARAMTWLPFLLPGLAHGFEKARQFASRKPERVVAGAGALLILWNLLFMEQYRRLLIPSDETVSFAQVTSNSAEILSGLIGTPFSWPANWLFARRFEAPVDRWETVAGQSLFAGPKAASTVIEIGDDPSAFARDRGLLLDGFGMRRTCERGWCRDVYESGRMLIPLQDPGRGDIVIRVRARGEGALRISFDGSSGVTGELAATLEDVTLRVPARLAGPGVHVLSISATPDARASEGRATLDRVTLSRDP